MTKKIGANHTSGGVMNGQAKEIMMPAATSAAARVLLSGRRGGAHQERREDCVARDDGPDFYGTADHEKEQGRLENVDENGDSLQSRPRRIVGGGAARVGGNHAAGEVGGDERDNGNCPPLEHARARARLERHDGGGEGGNAVGEQEIPKRRRSAVDRAQDGEWR